MMNVFLVDDEIAIRENLRNSFPWDEKGYQLVGEAPDGEMALQMIRDLNPEILLTDIRMPFMDGLALCREVRRIMPWISIIILSGYDDFSYAKEAISLGVQEYLLKPVTAQELERALGKIRDKRLEEQRLREHMADLRGRVVSGNAFVKDKLLASLFTEEGERYEDELLLAQMRELGVNLTAGSYSVIDIAFDGASEMRINTRAALNALAEHSGGTVYVCGSPKGARALVLGDNEQDVEERAYSFAASAIRLPELSGHELLLLCIGRPVNDFYAVRQSMKSARHLRHLVMAETHSPRRIIGEGEVESRTKPVSERDLSPIYERLQYANAEQVEPILMEYASALEPSLAQGYLRIAALISAQKIVQDAGGVPETVLGREIMEDVLHCEMETGFEHMLDIIRRAIVYRDNAGYGYRESPVDQGRAYLSTHFTDPNLMLSDVSDAVHMSQSHFSTVFAQETGITFTQYLTGLRMGKAKELLEATELRSSQIALESGYNDAHYFSYLFKKNTGMTPSEWRKAKKACK